MPLQRRIPKRGFRRLQKNEQRRDEFVEVNLGTADRFRRRRNDRSARRWPIADLARAGRKIKILGDGI